jgi:hypothetical protein
MHDHASGGDRLVSADHRATRSGLKRNNSFFGRFSERRLRGKSKDHLSRKPALSLSFSSASKSRYVSLLVEIQVQVRVPEKLPI